MFNGLVNTVLANVLAWEHETIMVGGIERHGIMAPVDLVQSELLEVSDKSGEEMSLWHGEAGLGVVLSELVHHEHGQVLIADVENEIWSGLIDFLWNVTLLENIEDVVAVSHEMSIDKVEWVPSPVNFSAICLGLSVSMECFVHEVVDVEVKILVETFFGHVLSKAAKETHK